MRSTFKCFGFMALLSLASCSDQPQSSSLGEAKYFQERLSATGIKYRPQYISLSSNENLKLYIIYDADVAPLQGIPLKALWLANTNVSDLSPLAGMPLECLLLNNTQVTDLTPLKNMPLKLLDFRSSLVTDLSPLGDLPIENLGFSPENITNGLDVIRAMTTISLINKHPQKRFWKMHDFRRDLYSGALDGEPTEEPAVPNHREMPTVKPSAIPEPILEINGAILEPDLPEGIE